VRPDLAEIQRRFIRALNALEKRDSDLLKWDVNERSITHKFAEHLQREFRSWNVDCEYNRDQGHNKELNLPSRKSTESNDVHATTVFPDIIIHHRGTGDNLVVIEAKKSTNTAVDADEWDFKKLEEFQRWAFNYDVAVFVKFQTGNDPNGQPKVTWNPKLDIPAYIPPESRRLEPKG
jgi:hypothetical protein